MSRLFRRLIPLLSLFAIVGMLRALDAATTLSGTVTIPSPTMVMPGAIYSGQALRLGESITNTFDPRVSGLVRPVGSQIYTRDGATASYIKTGTASTAWEPIGAGSLAGGATRVGALTARAAAVTAISPSLLTCSVADWQVSHPVAPNYVVTVVGSASSASTLTNVGGVAVFSTGATANSTLLITINGAVQLGPPTTSPFYYAHRMAVSTAIDANTQIGIGLHDTTFGTGLLWGICGASSTIRYTFNRGVGAFPCGGTVVITATTSTANTFHLFELWGLGDGSVHAAIDGTEISGSPFNTGIPAANAMLRMDFRNGATAANRAFIHDYYMLCWAET